MAGNQPQADHAISAASDDDTEAKLKNLEQEVDLIKTSIKRLLMDIRERMNELENPFTMTGPVSPETEAKVAALEAKEAALEAREAELAAAQVKAAVRRPDLETPPVHTPAPAAVPVLLPPQYLPQPALAAAPQPALFDERRAADEQLLAQFRSQLMGAKPGNEKLASPKVAEKLRLQKVYKLFKWTSQAVRKYGHDRLEIMLQSYRTMGYVSKESCDEIKEITRLMPANLGDEHEVGPEEYVSELYTLNRIIAPEDTTLDRDMIEVMMEQRSPLMPGMPAAAPAPAPAPAPTRIEFPTAPAKEKKSLKEREFDEDWMNLPDRI